MAEILIRETTAADGAAISALLEAAFDGPDEARLVRALREDGDLSVCLVAEDEGRVVGCVAFSPLVTPDAPTAKLFALAPLAVAAMHRRRGLGARLCEAGLEAVRSLGATGAVVLGDPAYYGRFGFQVAVDLHCDWSGPYLQDLVFEGGRPSGALRYARAFAEI